jgi:cytochrome c peroxidase
MRLRLVAILLITGIVVVSCGKKEEAQEMGGAKMTAQEQTELFEKAKSIFGALPDKMPGSENDTPELIELGKKLYSENKLSVNNTESCNTCHDLSPGKAGVDNKPVSPGAIGGKFGTRNSPTVLNAGFQFVQFWDGRAADLKEQAKGPILNPVEMAMKGEKDVEKAIGEIPEYKEMFAKAFPGNPKPITYDNLAHAIAAFERTLISRSRFDFYVSGNQKSLTDAEKAGLKTFIDVGCITCHTGPSFGGNIYQKSGLVHPYANAKDLGRYEVTKNEADKFMFKVPMLRNAALTAPYFHDGGIATLEDAIKTMAWISLGKELKPEEITSMVTFIKALNGKEFEKQ